ncbi:MAG TPA: hypothetical protein VGM67_12755 [Gemmatimonadaceae bacterium]|jgi:hypothetical protein
MTFPISTEDAKAQGLPGSDVYRRSAFLYLDDLHRHWGAVSLNTEAVRAFTDTIEISERQALAQHRAELRAWIANGALAAGLDMPWSRSDHDRMEYVNYEHLKLASGFELHLKARLLAAGYLVHCLDRNDSRYTQLSREQRERPVVHSEAKAVEGHQFDGKQNFLPGLTASSLKFSWITKKSAYRQVLGLSDETLNIIDDYRQLRNQIHLPGEFSDTPAIRAFGKPIIEFLLPFLNTEIVDWSNGVIEKYGLLFRKIPQFT